MNIADSYDAIPYESTPFAETHPGHIACLAQLHGIEAAPPTSCRVLELGCASGGNLLPMAARLPDSEFLGIELSPEQAEEGSQRILELGLKNCEIRQANLLDMKDEGVRFDYIITHGVYSWSPPEVRSRILELSGQLLSEHGIAYVSYNSLPGWRMRGMLRDMLMYHVRDLESPADRLATAWDYLFFLEAGLSELDAVHVEYLKVEIDRIRSAHPSYLYHEYLENYNDPVMLRDFINSAREYGLDYVCDIELGLQFPSYLGERAAEMLDSISDPIERWQQMDFLLNRNFHQSLLCHNTLQPLRSPDLDQLRNFAWIADLSPPRKLDLRRNKTQPYSDPQGEKINIEHPLTKAGIALLNNHFPAPMPYTDLLTQSSKWVRGNGGANFAEQEDAFLSELFTLYALGIIQARPADMLEQSSELSQWQMDAVARLGVTRGDTHIPTRHHASLSLDPFSSRLVFYLDGLADRDSLFQQLLTDFQPGGVLSDLAAPDTPPDKLASQLENNMDRLLALFQRHGVLG